MQTELIRRIEEMAARAWPAEVAEGLGGWLLRYSRGVTRRANSVLPLRSEGRQPLEERLARVEAFYEQRACPARYQLCPATDPPDLDRVLAERGYAAEALTAVQIAPATEVMARSRMARGHEVAVSHALTDAWFDTYCRAETVTEHAAEARRSILGRIKARTGYALLSVGGEVAAIGLGVVEEGWLGIFNMATRPEFRRRGAAMALLRALAAWGETESAAGIYLQVMEENEPARALYSRLGFSTLYHYHYRHESVPRADLAGR
jgi:ribosomal protein S18 acetylase RimI-like enzyme